MAAEFEKLATDFLKRLPDAHQDRQFLAGIRDVVAAYAEQRPLATGPVDSPAEEMSASVTELYDAGQPVPPVAVEAVATVEQAEQERVTLRGRLGKPPRFSDTPRGVRRAEFNLAVHEDDESTTWHTVLAFRQRAEKLEAANPQKGQYAEVIGYKHVEQRKDRSGNPKTVERIVAAHIRLH